MALIRPTLLPIAAFDATQEQVFNFTVQGTSSQVVANELIIRNQDNNDIVYDEKQETFTYTHIVNANELTNGTYYNASIIIFDAEGNQSTASIALPFWCYSTPSIIFTNIPSNNLVNNASFSFEFEYTQNENEPLNSYVVNLYNSSNVLISTSGEQYTNSNTVPFSGSYLFNGFENNTTYFIQIVGTTTENTVIHSDMQQLVVQYTQPDTYTLLQLTNNCEEGYITLQSNIILIEGESQPSPPEYINEDSVDLTEDGTWVQWNQGYNISGNNLTRVWFNNPNPYTTILQFSNIAGQQITINFMLGYENNEATTMGAYVEAYVNSLLTGTNYYIYSNYITPELSNGENYTLYLTQIDNIYQLQLLAPN